MAILTQEKIARARAYIEHKAGALKQNDSKARRTFERRLENRLVRRFKQQLAWIVTEAEKLPFLQPAKGIKRLERKTAQQEAEDLANRLPFHEEVTDEIINISKQSYKRGAKSIYVKMDMGKSGIDFSLVNQPAVEYLAKLKDLHLSEARGSIKRETKKRIIKLLTDAAESGASYQETARKIREQGDAGVFSRSRAELIATNNVGHAYGVGSKEMIDQYRAETGALLQKYWITVQDSSVTEECRANEAMGWIGIDEHFKSGDSFAPRESNPRCRCDTGYRQVDTQNKPI